MKNKFKIGIFGGTFDPFTIAHAAIVREVLDQKIVDKVIIVPTIVTYHREVDNKSSWLTKSERIEVINYFIEYLKQQEGYNVELELCEYEFAEKNSNYNISMRRYVDTITYLRDKYDYDKYDLFTIIGSDSYKNFMNWWRYGDILSNSKLIVINGRNHSKISFNPNDNLNFIYRLVDIPESYCDVSASEIRSRYSKKNDYLIEIFGKKFTFEKVMYKTPIFDLVEKHSCGFPFNPVGINSSDWVSILVEKDGKFLMEKQFRYGLLSDQIEFPCGMVDKSDVSLFDAARRELQEETGYLVNKDDLEYFGSDYANPAFMNNKMHYFYICLDDIKDYSIVDKSFDEHENITSYWENKLDIIEKFMNINNSFSVFMTNLLHRYILSKYNTKFNKGD